MGNKGKLVCTICPRGCELSWRRENDKIELQGHSCPRGRDYGLEELTAPGRTLTTTVKVEGGLHPLVPVRSNKAIPKQKLKHAMRDLARLTLTAPLNAGSTVLANWQGQEVDFITTRSMPKRGSCHNAG